MFKPMKAIAAIMLTMAMILVAGCKPEENNDNDVRVTTYTPQDITQTSAVCGGDVIVAQGLTLNEFGVCWSTERNPTASDAHRSTTNWSEAFVCTITGLDPGTEYHVRAYALHGLVYYYGEEKTFTAEDNGGGNNSNNDSDVRVTTYTPQNITATTAKCGGDVIVTQGLSLTELGICWSTEPNPTTDQNHLSTVNWNEPFVCTITGLDPGTEYHVRAYALRGIECYFGDEKSFFTDVSGGPAIFNGHEYIDLGLPSGTLWATYNVGAHVPEEYGDRFAWGETQTKSEYYWSTYKYCVGDGDNLTKYCSMNSLGYNGFTDNLTTLLPEDDAATVNWGEGWCMPTVDQWRELVQNTDRFFTTQNGANGLVFIANNGNSLFLPAASRVYYWSSTLHPCPDRAWFLDSTHGNYIFECKRYAGLPVRPVRSSR